MLNDICIDSDIVLYSCLSCSNSVPTQKTTYLWYWNTFTSCSILLLPEVRFICWIQLHQPKRVRIDFTQNDNNKRYQTKPPKSHKYKGPHYITFISKATNPPLLNIFFSIMTPLLKVVSRLPGTHGLKSLWAPKKGGQNSMCCRRAKKIGVKSLYVVIKRGVNILWVTEK